MRVAGLYRDWGLGAPAGLVQAAPPMSLSSEELAAIAAEVQQRLRGAVVQKAFSPLPALAFLELRVPGRSLLLCLSAEAGVGRLSLAPERLPTPGEPHPLQRWLRQELIGRALAGARSTERNLLLHFTGAEGARVLLLELGGGGALSVCTPEGRLLAQASASGRRGAAPGSENPVVLQLLALPAPEPVTLPEGARLQPLPESPLPLAAAAEALFAGSERERRAEAIRKRLERPHRARLGRLERTLAKVRHEAEREQEAEAHRRRGELLTHNLHRLPRGRATVRLTHYGPEGMEEVEVVLDGKRGPRELAEWHFHQYRRLQRGLGHARHRLLELEREASQSRQALAQLAAMSEDALLAQVEILGLPPESGGQAPARPFREHVSATGIPIWVGKGGESNQQLTFGVARPHHLWLHARGVPGAHVVVPLARGQVVDQETLLDAAHLALHHSDLKGQPQGEVSYVPRKYVRAVKGGAPGRVLYTQERTFLARVEPARLQRLLGGPERPAS